MSNTGEGSVATDSAAATDSTACMKIQRETDAFIRSSLGSLGEYKMDNKRRGHALIFNHEHFLCLAPRNGTNVDRDNLEKRLKELNFEVETHNDLKQKEVSEKISEAAGKDHSDADCFLLVFLSHGEEGHVWAHDEKISIQEDITSKFKGDKCSSLVGKPKIFIFQACRGNEPDNPVTPCTAVTGESDDVAMDTGALYTLPAGADFLMCYSVAEGYYSFRDTLNGSWYVQDLCDLLQKSGDSLEFTELLTWVNWKVSMREVGPCKIPGIIGKKQVPCFASMLTKKLIFKPKK